MKKKMLSLAMALLCLGSLSACGQTATTTTDETTTAADATATEATVDEAATSEDTSDSDYAYIQSNGKMVIGITEYAPMNYYDEEGTLIGFDTEFAQAVCEKLGVTPEFQIIDWDMKETELKAMNIDCIWNGLTVTEERRENMDFTQAYLSNKQCVVVNVADAETYTDAASLSSALITAEGGSAGETAITLNADLQNASYTASNSQTDCLLALKAGNYDAVVIDYTLAMASVGTGDFADMVVLDQINLDDELYAIGFRLGSDMTAKVDAIIDELKADGTLAAIAEKYEMTDLYTAVTE